MTVASGWGRGCRFEGHCEWKHCLLLLSCLVLLVCFVCSTVVELLVGSRSETGYARGLCVRVEAREAHAYLGGAQVD